MQDDELDRMADAAIEVLNRLQHVDDPDTLARVITGLTVIVGATPRDHKELPARLGALGTALQTRFLRTGRALEPAERGRGLMWAQLLATRGDLSMLAAVAPGMAERAEAIRAELG